MAIDFQHREGGKTGMGGLASWSDVNRDRKERLRQLAMETIDLAKDPYFMKNHLGTFECRLCLTLHNNEGSYLVHTQGKKHQSNLGKRAAKDAEILQRDKNAVGPEKPHVEPKKFVKIGRPGYRVTKQRDSESGQQSLLFQVDYPEIAEGIVPRHRFMAAYEQHVEAPDRRWQYIMFAAEPYETIAFKIPSREVDKGLAGLKNPAPSVPERPATLDNLNLDVTSTGFWSFWNRDTKQLFVQIPFKLQQDPRALQILKDVQFEREKAAAAQRTLALPPPPNMSGDSEGESSEPRGPPPHAPPMPPPSSGPQMMPMSGTPAPSPYPQFAPPPPPSPFGQYSQASGALPPHPPQMSQSPMSQPPMSMPMPPPPAPFGVFPAPPRMPMQPPFGFPHSAPPPPPPPSN
jgi:splicing factor 3A subunit 2